MAALSGIFVPNIVPYDARGRIAEAASACQRPDGAPAKAPPNQADIEKLVREVMDKML
jgi:hypothetical protein